MAWLDKITGAIEDLAMGSARKKREAKEAQDAEDERIAEEEKKKKRGARGPFMGRGQMSEEEWRELDKASGGK